MNTQTLIVSLIVFAALAYVGLRSWRKLKSFSAKKGCVSDCGCSASSKTLKNLNL